MNTLLRSMGDGLHTLVVGATGGIGSALMHALAAEDSVDHVFALSRQTPLPSAGKIDWLDVDVLDADSLKRAASQIIRFGPLHLVIVATGELHAPTGLKPEKRWEDFSADDMARAFAINATGPALAARYFLPLLARDRTTVFAALSARVGSITDNRKGGWYSYRASKAALNMLLRNFAIELERRNPAAICVGLHPGTVDTALSRPFQTRVPQGQLSSPQTAATRLLDVIARLEPGDSGKLLAWDGKTIPF